MTLEAKIEALLFFKGEPMTLREIAASLEADLEEVKAALASLRTSLNGRGVVIVEADDKVMLGTTPEMSELFEKIRKEELNKELSKAALETLSVVMYKDGVTRAEINFIRGVNSGFILRMLEVRGLIEKETHKTDARMYVYKPTLELLSFMGVTSVSELPEFAEVKAKLENKILNGNDENSIE